MLSNKSQTLRRYGWQTTDPKRRCWSANRKPEKEVCLGVCWQTPTADDGCQAEQLFSREVVGGTPVPSADLAFHLNPTKPLPSPPLASKRRLQAASSAGLGHPSRRTASLAWRAILLPRKLWHVAILTTSTLPASFRPARSAYCVTLNRDVIQRHRDKI